MQYGKPLICYGDSVIWVKKKLVGCFFGSYHEKNMEIRINFFFTFKCRVSTNFTFPNESQVEKLARFPLREGGGSDTFVLYNILLNTFENYSPNSLTFGQLFQQTFDRVPAIIIPITFS